MSANFSDSCASSPPNMVHFTNANIVSYLQSAANNDTTSLNFALKSPNEAEKLQWKQFATNPSLVVRYDFPPSAPTGLQISHAVSCGGTVYTSDAFPTLSATATDNNPSPLPMNMWFEVWPEGGSARVSWSGGIGISSGARGSWTVNMPGGLGNGNWQFRVKVDNLPSDTQHLDSAWSAWFHFVSRGNPITQAPRVISFDYPDSGYWGPPQEDSPTFMVDTNGAPDIAGFSYTWAGSGTEPALTSADCNYDQTSTNGGWIPATSGRATIAVPPTLAPGFHSLYVRSFDDAHNLSPESSAYQFYLAPNLGAAATRLEANDPAQVTLGQPAGQSAPFTAETGDSMFLSDGSQEVFGGTAAGQSFTATFTAAVEADYALGTKLTMGPDRGQLRFDLDGTVLAHSDIDPLDTYLDGTASIFQRLGGIHLTTGTHTLTITVVGTNPASTGDRYNVGLDFLLAIPFNAATADSFTDAMNNHGFGVDNTTAADLDLSAAGNSLSTQTVAAAGYAPGSTITVDGANFTMPAANPTTGNDNVIATGQTIPLPATKATAVGVLAAATCGSIPAIKMKITYTDSTVTNPLLAAVPDWFHSSVGPATLVLPYLDRGLAIRDDVEPGLYAIFVPTDPTKTPASITLPYTGSSLLPGTCPPTLHILAIAPRPVGAATGWIGTWAATTEAAVTPPGGAGLADQTLRLVVHPTVTGTNTRIRLSNTDSPAPVTIDDATIAAQSGTAAATVTTPAQLSFCTATGQPTGCGAHSITLAAGAEAYSDPITYPDTTPGTGNLIVSIHLPTAVTQAPVHTAGNTTNYLAAGDATANQDGTPFTTSFADSYYLTAVDVSTTDSSQGTIAVLGDQTSATGAPGSTYQPTWVDDLPAKLGTNLPGGLVNASLAGTQTTDWWRAAETGTALNQSIFDEPNLRTVIVALGAQDILQNTTPATIEDNLTALLHNPAIAYSTKNYRRSDGSAIHIVLATVPPLGLVTDDQREINRQQLNTFIRANFVNLGADDVFDLDQAVRDSTNVNMIDPGFLTGGVPNASYYDTVAQALADAVETFPPTAQL